jgi:hypothetical protein
MNKRTTIKILLAKINEQIDELLDNESTEDMSAEEILVLATELVTSNIVTTISYNSPVGSVNKADVSWDLGDDYVIRLQGDDDDI